MPVVSLVGELCQEKEGRARWWFDQKQLLTERGDPPYWSKHISGVFLCVYLFFVLTWCLYAFASYWVLSLNEMWPVHAEKSSYRFVSIILMSFYIETDQLERVFLRLGHAETDEQLQDIISKFLPPVLLKLSSVQEGVRKKVSFP